MDLFFYMVVGFGLLLAGMLFVLMSISWFRGDDVSQRLQTYVGDSETRSRRMDVTMRIRNQELRGTFIERTLFPFLRRNAELMSKLLPSRQLAILERKLQLVGNPLGFRAREYLGLHAALVILGIVLAAVIYSYDLPNRLWLSIAAPLLALVFPIVWLNRGVRNKQNQIRKELPDVIDMLSVCTSAGLSFDQSLQRVSDEWRTNMSWELGRVVSEMEMGLTRKDALRNLANRLDISEVSSFASIIIQSDQLGMSISKTLHVFAQQMRVEWRYRAKEEAQKIPIKILIPLVFFIFPAMIAVILGPSIPAILDLFDTI